MFYMVHSPAIWNMTYSVVCLLVSIWLRVQTFPVFLITFSLHKGEKNLSIEKREKRFPPYIFSKEKNISWEVFGYKMKTIGYKKRRVLTCQTGKRLVYLCLVRIFIIVIVWEGITQASNLKENGCINIIFKSFLLTTHDHKTKPACIRK